MSIPPDDITLGEDAFAGATLSDFAFPANLPAPPSPGVTLADPDAARLVPDLDAARLVDPSQKRESAAKTVALVLVGSFASTILLNSILTCIIFYRNSEIEKAESFVKITSSLYEALGKFISPV